MNSTSNEPDGSSIPDRGEGQRALVIRIGALGDVLLTRRLTYSLQRAGLRSTLMTPARHASILLADPWIEGIMDSEAPTSAAAFAGEWPRSAGRFEVAVVISRSTDLVDAARQAARVTIQIPPPPVRNDSPVSVQWAEAARDLCDPFTGVMAPLATRTQDARVVDATLVHPGSGSPRKNWPTDRFLELSRKLTARGERMVWVRGPAEMAQPDGWEGERLDRPSLSTLAATLAASRRFVGNDSGVSHLAAAVGTPTIALFGPTPASVWRPDGPRVRVVDSTDGTMNGVSVEAVLDALKPAH